jgi:hypothetical protein
MICSNARSGTLPDHEIGPRDRGFARYLLGPIAAGQARIEHQFPTSRGSDARKRCSRHPHWRKPRSGQRWRLILQRLPRSLLWLTRAGGQAATLSAARRAGGWLTDHRPSSSSPPRGASPRRCDHLGPASPHTIGAGCPLTTSRFDKKALMSGNGGSVHFPTAEGGPPCRRRAVAWPSPSPPS